MSSQEFEHQAQNPEEIGEFKELPEGPFKDYVLYVSQNLVQDEEYTGDVVYYPTLERIHHYLDPEERPKRSRATLVRNQIRPLHRTLELPLRTVGARSSRRQLTDHDTFYISASYLYTAVNDPVKNERGYINPIIAIEGARKLWGEHPIGARIDTLLETVPEGKKKVKRPVKEKDDAEEMEQGVSTFIKEKGNVADLEDVMLRQVDSNLVRKWILQITDPMVSSRFIRNGVIDWEEANVPYTTALKIDYIRRAHKRILGDNNEQIDIVKDELREGLIVVLHYLEKYSELPNLKALYELVKEEVSKNPQKYTGGNDKRK